MCAKNITSAWLGSSLGQRESTSHDYFHRGAFNSILRLWLQANGAGKVGTVTQQIPRKRGFQPERGVVVTYAIKTPLKTSAEVLLSASHKRWIVWTSVPLPLWAAQTESLWTCHVLERLGWTPALTERVRKEAESRVSSQKKKKKHNSFLLCSIDSETPAGTDNKTVI